MNITVNENVVVVAQECTIEQLLISLDKPLTGSALAVNQNIISRAQWADHKLCEGDQISLFQAIAGG
jgi:sulfur carrier protein